MTIQEQLQSVLTGLAAGGAWSQLAAQGTVAPYIVWSGVVSAINNNLLGASDVQNTRFQIDAYATSYAGARTLAAAVVAAMKAASFANVQISDQDMYEPDTKLFRVSMDFSVWSA